MSANGHATDCGWQFEQYPHECDCGAISGKLGQVTLDRQLFEAMFATLQRKQAVFEHYGHLHAEKETVDGDRKAMANKAHGSDIAMVLKRVGSVSKAGRPTMHLDMLDAAYDITHESGKRPVAYVVTNGFMQQVARDLGVLAKIFDLPEKTLREYRGCEIISVPEDQWHTAVVCCSEDSPILKIARAMRSNG